MEEGKLFGKKLLLVEDDQLTFLFIQQVLRNSGIVIIRACTGKEAIHLVSTENNIDCALVDIQLPDMNGDVVVELIRPLLPNIPIIAQTASRSDEIKENVMQKGASNFIHKPYKAIELLALIETLILE